MINEVNNNYASTLVQERSLEVELAEPALYQVNLHNDDYTPMEFVVEILERFFFMDRSKAAQVMLEAHIKGKAACGVYTKDVAETKVEQVVKLARQHEHPLTFSLEVIG